MPIAGQLVPAADQRRVRARTVEVHPVPARRPRKPGHRRSLDENRELPKSEQQQLPGPQLRLKPQINYPNYDPLTDKRIIKVYVIPYGALKNSNGNDEIPVLDFAAYYVTAYASGNDEEPCPGNDNARLPSGPSSVVGGYFINFVGPPGPVDPNASCTPNQIRPCRAVLER